MAGASEREAKTDVDWVAALRSFGKRQEDALAALRSRLLAGVIAYLKKNHVSHGALSAEEARQIAEDCVQEAILVVLHKLESFRGESRFTTWASTIAIRLVLAELRRRRWRTAAIGQADLGVELPVWPYKDAGPERSLQQQQAWTTLVHLIDSELTPKQRTVLIAHAFQEMPLDAVAEWLGTNRNSLYKVIHDTRKRLRRALLAQGVTYKDLIALFDEPGPDRR